MELHGDVLLVVHSCKSTQDECSVCICLDCCRLFAVHLLLEYLFNFFFAPECAWASHEGMVRCLASHFNEEIESLFKCLYNVGSTLDFQTSALSKLFDVSCEVWLIDVQSLVWAVGRDNLCRTLAFVSDDFVPLEVVCWVVCCSDCIDVEFLHDSPNCEVWVFCKLLVCFFIDLLSILSVEDIVDSKISLEFQVCPMVERVADKVLHCFCPCCEL